MKRQFKFTKKTIEGLPPCPPDAASTEQEYSDQDIAGLRLQVNRLGRKVFLWRYQIEGRKRALKIGSYPETSIDAARQQVIEWRALLAKGIDPQDQREEERKGGITYQAFYQDYLLPHIKATKRSFRVDQSRAVWHILPAFGHREMAKISTLEWQRFHNEKKLQLSPATSNRILENVKRAYTLSIQWGLLPPSAHTPQPVRMHQENNIRTRYLSMDELHRFMHALDNSPNRIMADFFQLLLATGCRKNEILQLRHSDVNMEQRLITIPNPKSGRARHVVMNEQARAVLLGRQPAPNNPYVFPGKVQGRPIFNPKRAWLAVLKEAGIDHKTTTLHTLRHTFASILVNEGVSLQAVSELLGHHGTDITIRYAHLSASKLRQSSDQLSVLMTASQGGMVPPAAP
ncbi:tyrosine-type recombinase/integrase [Polaromonas sp. DSR2-3-2]|uniref:tyrosine-type recombinase/integrase n=1 Tax=unclassified Polaromonas TaxID=2638319 RepID=UPI003CF18EA5